MAKISRAQGPSMSADEFEAAENVQPNVKIRRPEVGPMRRVDGKGDAPSAGTKSSRSTEDSRKRDNSATNNPSERAPKTENPSPQVEGATSDADSVAGVPTGMVSPPFAETEEPNVGKALGEPEPQEKPDPKATKVQGKRTPQRGSRKAPAGAEDETPDSTKTATVRFTDDDF